MKYIMDTHVWIWWNSDVNKLSKKTVDLISNIQYTELLLSAISCWEFSKLVEKGRLNINISGERWLEKSFHFPKFQIIPISPEIAWNSCNLPGEFHDDPADQIIVATARTEGAIIITKDKLISKYKNVKCFW